MKTAREDAQLSQREVACRMGMAETAVGRIERAERAVDVIEFVDYARAIGVDPLELLGNYLVSEQKARLEEKV